MLTKIWTCARTVRKLIRGYVLYRKNIKKIVYLTLEKYHLVTLVGIRGRFENNTWSHLKMEIVQITVAVLCHNSELISYQTNFTTTKFEGCIQSFNIWHTVGLWDIWLACLKINMAGTIYTIIDFGRCDGYEIQICLICIV